MTWTPQRVREVVTHYGAGDLTHTVTVQGLATDSQQRKHVTRWKEDDATGIGYILYDLNINGYASDLTALFAIDADSDGLIVMLDDIHVM